MFGTLIKKKIDANKLANVFVNSIMEAIDSGFQDITELITEDAAFVDTPQIKPNFSDNFLMIIISGNMRFLDEYFEIEEASEIKSLIIQKMAVIYSMQANDFRDLLEEFDEFISKVNYPSKNTLYGMSKAVFHKFDLNKYQESYFKSMKTPNPLFLKRMDEIIMNFIWDWEQFFKKHKLNHN